MYFGATAILCAVFLSSSEYLSRISAFLQLFHFYFYILLFARKYELNFFLPGDQTIFKAMSSVIQRKTLDLCTPKY